MFHNSTITIKGTRFQCVVSTIGQKTKKIIHTTVGVLKSLTDTKTQKKFQRIVKKDKAFKEYMRQMLLDFENIPVYGALINGTTFVVIDGQHRVWHILTDDTEIEVAIFEVPNWPAAADKFYDLNNSRPVSAAIVLHNSAETGKYLRSCIETMKECGYIDGYNLEGRGFVEDKFFVDCQDVALLIKSSVTGKSQGALHTWIRTHKHEHDQTYVAEFITWLVKINNNLMRKVNNRSIFERNVQVAIACTYANPETRELVEENIAHYVTDKNYKLIRENMSSRGSDRAKAWACFLTDADETCKGLKVKADELRVVAVA